MSDPEVGAPPVDEEAVLERHREERKAQVKAAERARARIPRKDRSGRQRATEEAEAAAEALKTRQREELEELGIDPAKAADQNSASAEDGVASAMNGLGVGGEVESGKKKESKAARRRRQKAEADAESERRIAEEKANRGPSERLEETVSIMSKLAPLGFSIRDIPPDGHCLYAAVADQLREVRGTGEVGESHDVSSLRAATAEHMLANQAEFAPFLEGVDGEEGYREYCERMRREAVWGGQVELGAMAKFLSRRVEVFSADMPLVVMGDAAVEGAEGKGVLRLSYHRKYYDLGEHYNSVVSSVGKV